MFVKAYRNKREVGIASEPNQKEFRKVARIIKYISRTKNAVVVFGVILDFDWIKKNSTLRHA